MKTKYLYLLVVLALSSCGINKLATSNLYEDDIYYNPNERSLAVKEVEKDLGIYNQDDNKPIKVKSNSYKETATNIIKNNRRQYPNITNRDLRNLNIASISLKENAKTGISDTIIEILNKGFWINDFTGTNYNLEEAMRTIDRFPNGFGYNNMYTSERANTLSFNPNWNVFTRDGRYWWFPVYGSARYSLYPHLRRIDAWNYGNFDYLNFGIHNRRFYAYNMYGHRSSFYGDFWGNDYLYDNYYGYGYNNTYLYGNRYNYAYGYGYYGYGYGYYDYGYGYNRYNRSSKLRQERGVTNVRATRSPIRFNNNGRTYQNVSRSNTNLRRSSFNKRGTSKINTNYKRKKINYSRQKNSTRPSYNSSSNRGNSYNRNNSSSSSSNNSSSNNSSSGQVRRR